MLACFSYKIKRKMAPDLGQFTTWTALGISGGGRWPGAGLRQLRNDGKSKWGLMVKMIGIGFSPK